MTSYSTDGGASWVHDTCDDVNARGTCIAFDPDNAGRVFVGGDSGYSYRFLKVTTDLGATWTRCDTGLSGQVLAILAARADVNNWYCGTGAGFYKSTDDGFHWTRKGTIANVRAICVDTVSASVVYAGTASGVYVSTDAGETWNAMNTGLGNTDVLTLALCSGPLGALYAGTNGGALYVTQPLLGIEEKMKDEGGKMKAGPTIARGLLKLQLPISNCRSAGLLDAGGRKVMELHQGDNDVRHLAAGQYFIVSTATGTASLLGKVVLQH